jgi:hypothetical protein
MKAMGSALGGLVGGLPGAIGIGMKLFDKKKKPAPAPAPMPTGGSTSSYGTVIPGSGA